MTADEASTTTASHPLPLEKYLMQGEPIGPWTLMNTLKVERQQVQNMVRTLEFVTGQDIPRCKGARCYTTTHLALLQNACQHSEGTFERRLRACLAKLGYPFSVEPRTLNELAGEYQVLQDRVAQLQQSVNALQAWQQYVDGLIEAERPAQVDTVPNTQTVSATLPQAGPAEEPDDQGSVDAAGQLDDTATGRSDDTAAGCSDNAAPGRPDDTATGWPDDTVTGWPVDTAAVQSDDTVTGQSNDTVTAGADNTATGW
jgi:hypothetical protein